jgi:excisionase family DNA binding protein
METLDLRRPVPHLSFDEIRRFRRSSHTTRTQPGTAVFAHFVKSRSPRSSFDEIVQRGYKSGMSSPIASSFLSEGGTRLRLLNVKEVAKRLDLSLPRVYELARGGILPVVRLGRQIRVDEGRLIAWINDGGRALPGGWKRDP